MSTSTQFPESILSQYACFKTAVQLDIRQLRACAHRRRTDVRKLASARQFIYLAHIRIYTLGSIEEVVYTHHQFHSDHMHHRFVCSPTQPSQAADSALCQRCTLALPRLRVFSVRCIYTQSIGTARVKSHVIRAQNASKLGEKA